MLARSAGLAIALAAVTLGCGSGGGRAEAPSSGGPAGETAPAEASAAANPWEACYSTFAPTGDARGDLDRLVRDCGAMGGMRPITAPRMGQQSDQDPVDRYTFEVPKAGTCYRVYAAGDASVEDLDLLLRGPAGTPAVADLTHDAWPVLPPREPICFDAPGLYQLEVSVYRGSGKYALQVWGR